MSHKHREQWATNRDIAKRPRKSLFWCWKCDMCLVAEGQKCPKCGCRNGNERKRRLKK